MKQKHIKRSKSPYDREDYKRWADTMRTRLIPQMRDSRHVLMIVEHRDPFAVLVRRDALEPLEHLVAFDREPAGVSKSLGQNRAPDRMRVQYGASGARPHDLDMQLGLSGGLPAAASSHHAAIVDFEELIRRELSFEQAAGGDGQPEGIHADYRAEVAARAEHPPPRVEPPTNLGQSLRDRAEIARHRTHHGHGGRTCQGEGPSHL